MQHPQTPAHFFHLLTEIPHCSHAADALRDFLVDFGRERGYRTEIDSANNILIYRGRPKLSLQAHYDMVCMGKAPQIEVYEEEGWLKAKDASLGADNGIGIAMMMALMEEGLELEFLLTADEEVGLIGAAALAFPLYSRAMLNLDFEEEGEVCIGCAGGADIIASITDTMQSGTGICYEVAVRDLPGGHSGVDIDKQIPSAIKVLAAYLYEAGVTEIASLYGGERSNAIPSNAVAIVCSKEPLVSTEMVAVRRLSEQPDVYTESRTIVEMLAGFAAGVREYDETLGLPHSSINLAIVTADPKGHITVECSARAMDMERLSALTEETIGYFEQYGYSTRLTDKYPAWKPERNTFTELVSREMTRHFGSSRTVAIHAGLECGVISQKYPDMLFASIGPTIRYPHSTRERVKVASIEDTFAVLRGIVAEMIG